MTIDKIIELAGGGRPGSRPGNTILNRSVQVIYDGDSVLSVTAVSTHPDYKNMALDPDRGKWYHIDLLEPYT